MKDIKQLISQYHLDIESFDKALKDFEEKSTPLRKERQIILKNDNDVNMALMKKLEEILSIGIKEAGIKREVGLFTGYYAEKDISAYIEDYDQNNHYSLKLWMGIILVGDIDGNKLKYADDKVWMLFTELIGKYNVKFREAGTGQANRDDYPDLYKKNSTFIRIMRNFYMHEFLYGRVKEFGPLRIEFDGRKPLEQLIPEIVDAFCIFNKINELLHKTYIKHNKG